MVKRREAMLTFVVPTPDYLEDQAERIRPATRITLRPHDPSTGEEVEKEEIVGGTNMSAVGTSPSRLTS